LCFRHVATANSKKKFDNSTFFDQFVNVFLWRLVPVRFAAFSAPGGQAINPMESSMKQAQNTLRPDFSHFFKLLSCATHRSIHLLLQQDATNNSPSYWKESCMLSGMDTP